MHYIETWIINYYLNADVIAKYHFVQQKCCYEFVLIFAFYFKFIPKYQNTFKTFNVMTDSNMK